MLRRSIRIVDAEVLILGLTFKENCPDVRNTRVVDMVRELESYDARVSVYDPQADPAVVPTRSVERVPPVMYTV